MNELHIEDFVDGFQAALKQASGAFDVPGNVALFPNLTSQAKWQYARGDKFLRLSDGQHVYSFNLPNGLHDTDDFVAKREQDGNTTSFREGATQHGLAQVHRADPGSIYFTLQEGHRNPTITLKHVGEDEWRGMPKKRKTPKLPLGQPLTEAIEEVKAAQAQLEQRLQNEKTAAGIFDSAIDNVLKPAGNLVQRAAQFPGELAHNNGALVTGGIGALGGLGYHLGRQALYNTPEENAEENQDNTTLMKRIGIPALALGGVGAVEAPLFKQRYEDINAGAGGVSNLF